MARRQADDPIRVVGARPRDGKVLCELMRSTYTETFVGVSYYTADLVEGYCDTVFTSDRLASELSRNEVEYLLLQEFDQTIGYAKLVEGVMAPCLAGCAAIYLERLYLTKEFQGRGLGGRLLAHVYDKATQRGYNWLWLSVWEHNRRAIEFYRKKGYQKRGEWEWRFTSHGREYVDVDWVMMTCLSPPYA